MQLLKFVKWYIYNIQYINTEYKINKYIFIYNNIAFWLCNINNNKSTVT